ncbi:hypothetical protein CHIBITOTORO_00110 [Serratia phage vB_SmaM-ChibiTotoro]|nr:hypothetical protein CHIBITOTORO_00110 [Serratia phage vB_SmaM-ChibiTotoro]
MKPRFRAVPVKSIATGMTVMINATSVSESGVYSTQAKILPVSHKVKADVCGPAVILHCWDNDIRGPRVLVMDEEDTILAKCVLDYRGDWVVGYPWVITDTSVLSNRPVKVDGFDVVYLSDGTTEQDRRDRLLAKIDYDLAVICGSKDEAEALIRLKQEIDRELNPNPFVRMGTATRLARR